MHFENKGMKLEILMNLTDFAPKEFKEHLEMLKCMAVFNNARQEKELGISQTYQHYILTGNEGVGKENAADEIFAQAKNMTGVSQFIIFNAALMFDPNDGFESNLANACSSRDIMLYIKNADYLRMKGNASTKTGIETLCSNISKLRNSIVVLSGNRSRIQEVINSCEEARALFPNVFHFEDLKPEVLYDYLIEYAFSQNYGFDPSTENVLRSYLNQVYQFRGANFRNTVFIKEVFDKEILPKMMRRVVKQNLHGGEMDLYTIMPEDIPEIKLPDTEQAIGKLNDMVGLDEVKKQVLYHTALVKLNKIRANKGLYNKMPPMHMVFTGNPGTGKTTVAKYIGEIYHSIGVLSSGHVVETERTKLVGEYLGVTEKNTLNAINSARGGVLFIDEAYNLFVEAPDKRDFGMRVIETLLTYLSEEEPDMIVIIAGYTNEMKKMLEANPGMKSRFPYVFHFEDYTPKQLMQIGKKVLEQENYTMTPEAERKLGQYIINEYDHKDEHFGNGRFITRLITSRIIPALSQRLLSKSLNDISVEELTTIEACDIPDIVSHEFQLRELDETILTEALLKLDQLVGLQNAKQALKDYVAISKLQYGQGSLSITPHKLYWDFIGKTGTGKSTVAAILGKILQGLGILKRGHIVSVSADELTGNDGYQVLERSIKEAEDGLLFLDIDAPNSTITSPNHLKVWIIKKLRELKQTTAVVIAQIKASEDMIAQNLATNGIGSYCNTIVFDDYSAPELSDILFFLLKRDYQLEINPNAKHILVQYVNNIKASENRDMIVNARTVQHLAQTVARIAQLRISNTHEENYVTLQDVAQFKWSSKSIGKIGFFVSAD